MRERGGRTVHGGADCAGDRERRASTGRPWHEQLDGWTGPKVRACARGTSWAEPVADPGAMGGSPRVWLEGQREKLMQCVRREEEKEKRVCGCCDDGAGE